MKQLKQLQTLAQKYNITGINNFLNYLLDLLPARLHSSVGKHLTSIAEVMGSNPVEASDFFATALVAS